ncbi:hypothetical protein CTAYLR_002697 [Chrysophaeum taylorii]|uniref:Uncharacterized protein n=1 Tax=Chrysophaeum taylorii TaxID=2483200 RepID=A0AAD7UC88_9STRA|nr:hypothetical protein CTAYLR_002697 [Chrysophaeum taylorii]
MDVTVRETSFAEGKLGHAVWTCGVGAATWCALNAHRFEGRRVLELGAGVGLVGVVCGKAANARVVMTDLDGQEDGPSGLVSNLRHNIDLNRIEATACRLDWHSDDLGERFDVVVASDCVYYPENVVPLAKTVQRHLEPEGVAYVFSAPPPGTFWRSSSVTRAASSSGGS